MSLPQTLKPIIIRKKVKLPTEPPHGAWKVAYADFVTAMMAFFLLLWLLNVTTDNVKKGISNYFEIEGVTTQQSGSGGILSGIALATEGALRSSGSPPSVTIPIATFDAEAVGEQEGRAEMPRKQETADPSAKYLMRMEEERARLREAQAELQRAIQEIPELNQLQDSLLIDETPEGLRIQIVDQDKLSMFESGKAELKPHARRLIAMIANIIAKLPNELSISGHTDAAQFGRKNYTNWELSGDRANAARSALVEFGVPADRIAAVLGKADHELLLPKEPLSARNRRISIVLLREPQPKPSAETKQPAPASPVAPSAPQTTTPQTPTPQSPTPQRPPPEKGGQQHVPR